MGVILLIRYRNHLRNECIYVRRINCVRLQYFQWHGKINFHLKVLCCGYGLLHRDKKQNVVICHSWLKNCWGFCNFFRRPNLVYEFFLYTTDANSTNSKLLSNTLLYFPRLFTAQRIQNSHFGSQRTRHQKTIMILLNNLTTLCILDCWM